MTKKRLINCIILTVFLSSAPVAARVVDRVAATVDGKAITTLELDRAMIEYGPEIQKQTGATGSAVRAKVLDKLIDNAVLEISLEKTKVKVETHEIDSYVDRMRASYKMTPEQFEQQLIKEGHSLIAFRENLEKQMKRDKFLDEVVGRNINIPENELRAYFDENMDSFKSPTSASLAQITIPFTYEMKPEDFEKIQMLAISIATEAKAGSDFKQLAEKHNGKPYKVDGGNFGIVNITDLQSNVAQVVKQLDIGQVSQPMPTNTGIVIIKVIDRAKTSSKDFSSLRDQIYSTLYNKKLTQAVENYLRQQRKNANIEIKSLGSY